MVHSTHSFMSMFPTHLAIFLFSAQTFARPRSNHKLRPVIHRLAQLTLSFFVLLSGGPHLSSLPFQSNLSKTRVRALAQLPCMCPFHAAWPPRPCARSPSRDVCRSSNLPAHFLLYLAASRAPPSSPTPSSRTHDQLGPSRVMPHLPGSLAHMLACVWACQLCAPSPIASSSSIYKRRTSGPLSPLANAPCSHMLVRCASACVACTVSRRSVVVPTFLCPCARPFPTCDHTRRPYPCQFTCRHHLNVHAQPIACAARSLGRPRPSALSCVARPPLRLPELWRTEDCHRPLVSSLPQEMAPPPSLSPLSHH
jgi:hypothetical protein